MISVIFNFCGDGHVGHGMSPSSYRQVRKEALNCFIRRLENIFGKFEVTIVEDSKVIVPRIITDFYTYYFRLNDLRWYNARIPTKIKNMPKDFLVAGLTAFVVDEGHIGDIIEIYSKNKKLINDIKEIAVRLGYHIYGPRLKYRYGKPDCYRIYISLHDAERFYNDILFVSKNFPMCSLAHKMPLLNAIVSRQRRGYAKAPDGITKKKILKLLSKRRTIKEMAEALRIGYPSLREHLDKLEKTDMITRIQVPKKHALLFERKARLAGEPTVQTTLKSTLGDVAQ